MAGEAFFEAPEEHSIVKTTLVGKYFDAWATLILRVSRPGSRLAYMDLYSGPGLYQDGRLSTPLLVLDHAIKNVQLCARLLITFNDKKPEYAAQLQAIIDDFPGIEKMVHQPLVTNIEVSGDLVNQLRGNNRVPTLFFIDPFGYKGLSLDLIGEAIRNWGCDCIFFFNYNRINPAITNLSVPERMNDIFGTDRAERLREKVKDLSPDRRQATIINEFTEAIKGVGGSFILPFKFQSQHGVRTSHYIIFVSKVFIAYHIMKDVMAKETSDTGEVRNLEYVPVKSTQMALFADYGRDHTIPLLKEVLISAFRGQTRTVWDLYETITPDTLYTLKNLKDALRELEAEKKITIEPPAAQRKKIRGEVSLADDKHVTFPL